MLFQSCRPLLGKSGFLVLTQRNPRVQAQILLSTHFEETGFAEFCRGRYGAEFQVRIRPKVEAIFKGFGRALAYGCSTNSRLKELLPSTKGLL